MKLNVLRTDINEIFERFLDRRRPKMKGSAVDVESVRAEINAYLETLPGPEFIETTSGIKKFENFDSLPKADAVVIVHENEHVIFTRKGYEARMDRLNVLLTLTAAAAVKRVTDQGAGYRKDEMLGETIRWAIGTACQIVLGDEHAFEPDVTPGNWMGFVQQAAKKESTNAK
jgi:hypothetical protein